MKPTLQIHSLAIVVGVLCMTPLAPVFAAPNDQAPPPPQRGVDTQRILDPIATPLPPRLMPDGDWVGLQIGSNPSRRLQPAYARDTQRDRVVIVGGSNGAFLADAAVIELETHPFGAVLATQGTPPPARRLGKAIYDPVGDRLILFGGYDGTYFSDLWSLSFATDPPTWAPLAADGTAPVPRAGHTMVYDPAGHRAVVFGGHDGITPGSLRRNDVWQLTLGGTPAWSQVVVSGDVPVARSSHAAVFDAAHQRMIVFGGTSPAYLDDTWQLDLAGTPAWSAITQGRRPSHREEHILVMDSARQRVVMHGGYDSNRYLSDTWILRLDNRSRWEPMHTSNDATPSARWGHVGIQDVTHDRMLVFGGYSSSYMSDTWALNWTSLTDPLSRGPAYEEPLESRREGVLSVWSPGQARLRCVLPSSKPATIEVLDVRGRRVALRALPEVLGEHDVDLAGDVRDTGVYFVRLVQDGTIARARFARLH